RSESSNHSEVSQESDTVSTDYSEPVATKGAAPAAFQANSAVIVRFVYRLEEAEGGARALTDPARVSGDRRLCVTEVIHYDGFGNLIAVRGAEDAEVEAGGDDLEPWSYMPVERETDPDWLSL